MNEQQQWHGMLLRDHYPAEALKERDAVADAAKAYDWRRLLKLLEGERDLVNTWRVGGTSWYAPLHQAAHGGAPSNIVEQLLELGAWRTLPTATAELPINIARARHHDHLVPLLEARPVVTIEASALAQIQRVFHSVIENRISVLEGVLQTLRLPELGPVTEHGTTRFWFPVPGMYGGFAYWLEPTRSEPTLITESWCRVVGGSGQRHEVTTYGAELVAEGFV